MTSNDERVRDAIAQQAGEWFVENDDRPLDARDSEALAGWLTASPVHVEDFLGVSVLARDLAKAGADLEFSVERCLALARAEGDPAVAPLRPRIATLIPGSSRHRWLTAVAATAACAVLILGLITRWNVGSDAPLPTSAGTVELRLETRHGEQLSRDLTDGSVVHLNTDSAVTIRYGGPERLVMLIAGEADFEVAHDATRPFRVVAGATEVVAIGTKFDVRLEHDSTVVTVIDGHVAVGPSPASDEPGARSRDYQSPRFVRLGSDQQIRFTAGQWPVAPETVDAQRTTAWLHRQIVFEQEPLGRVAAEFNRYAPTPFDITTPALRNLEVSGVFATDDTEAFIAFLRSLKGVRVEVTATRIRVSQSSRTPGPGFR
jgi:transmembrane sensor